MENHRNYRQQVFASIPPFLAIVALVYVGNILYWSYRQRRKLEREKAELLRTSIKLRKQAECDHLTDLWNRRIIVERLQQEVERSYRDNTPLSVIMVDLDHFKRVNDTFGHPAGDQVLRQVGAIFKNSLRSYDGAGRYGGEEFLLILPGVNLLNAVARAEQLRQSIESARFRYNGTSIAMTASFGVVSDFPTDPAELIHAVDAALYQAKNSGRNCIMTIKQKSSSFDLPQDSISL